MVFFINIGEKLKRFIRKTLIIIFSLIFIYCSYNIIKYIKSSKANEILIEDLKKEVVVDSYKNEKNTNNNENKKINFDKLHEINNNIKAWIYLKDSIIDYPIVKGNDNNFYLNHSVDGKYNPNGAIFIDYRNNDNFEDIVTYIYGHHMKNNKMFANLEFFKKQEYYDSHKDMIICTKNNNYKLELFAGFTTKDGANIYNYINSKSNQEIVKLSKSKSDFKANVDINNEEKIVVLSTCSYDFENARYVVLGVLRNLEKGDV